MLRSSATRGKPTIRKILLWGVLGLCAIVVVLNWTYGRLPATPSPRGHFIQLNGLRVRYLETSGSEPAVLLLHGLPGTAEDFEEVTPLLKGHRTVAIDRPGFGYSSGGYYPIGRQLRAVKEVIEKLHLGRPILVGHSYGGTISLAYAERHPAGVHGLVLVDAAAGSCPREELLAEAQARLIDALELPVVSQIANATFSQLLRTVSAKPVEDEAFEPAAVNPRHRRRVLSVNLRRNMKAYAGEMLAAGGVISGVNRGLAQIHVPTVVIQGEHDKLVNPECGRHLAASVPGARLRMVPGSHMAPYTHPATVAAAVQSVARETVESAG